MGVRDAVPVGGGVFVPVAVAVATGVGVMVGTGVLVAVAAAVGVSVGVSGTLGVGVKVSVAVGEAGAVGCAVAIGSHLGPASQPCATSGPLAATCTVLTNQCPVTVTVNSPCWKSVAVSHLMPVSWVFGSG